MICWYKYTTCVVRFDIWHPFPSPVSLAAALRPWRSKSKLSLMEIAIDEGRPVVVRLNDRSSVVLDGTEQVTDGMWLRLILLRCVILGFTLLPHTSNLTANI